MTESDKPYNCPRTQWFEDMVKGMPSYTPPAPDSVKLIAEIDQLKLLRESDGDTFAQTLNMLHKDIDKLKAELTAAHASALLGEKP